MNISMDLVLSAIIVGILITMITATNKLMIESTSEIHSTYQLQSSANNALLVVNEEVRSLKEIVSSSNTSLEFVESDLDTVNMFKNGEYLEVSTYPFEGGNPESKSYYLKLDSLHFETIGGGGHSPTFLRVTSVAKSSFDQQVDANRVYKAVAQRDIYLTNLHLGL